MSKVVRLRSIIDPHGINNLYNFVALAIITISQLSSHYSKSRNLALFLTYRTGAKLSRVLSKTRNFHRLTTSRSQFLRNPVSKPRVTGLMNASDFDHPVPCILYGGDTPGSRSTAPLMSSSTTKATVSSAPRTIAVAVTGVGLVGSEFISQLLSVSRPNPFRIVSLSSSRHTLFSANGLDITKDSWKEKLNASPPKSPEDLVKELALLVTPSQEVVFVDNTSNEGIAALYPKLLFAGINVITPNKKAFSGDLVLYDQILKAALESGAKYLNESTVGAGLPIISTLKDLVATGDKVCVLN